MIVNLYYPQDSNNNLITFSVLNAVNSINIIAFQINDTIAPTSNTITTRLVSGYERNRRNINVLMKCIATPLMDRSLLRHAYVVSCVRLPYVSVKLMMSKHFTRAVLPVIVDCNKEIQVWHVFGVAKNHEPGSLQKIKGVNVCENGLENYYSKELITFTGNIPARFISTLSKTISYVDDIGMAVMVYPNLQINQEDVTIVQF